MKRLILFSLMALFFVLTLALISCSEKKEPVVDESAQESQGTEEEFSELFLQTREDCEDFFFSYYAREGFGSYNFAFPSTWIDTLAKERAMDRKTFDDRTEEGCFTMAVSRAEFYGENYVIDWENTKDEKIEGDELQALKDSLSGYGVPTDTVLEAVRSEYTLSYFEDDTKEKLVSEAAVEIVLVKIADEGWTVSPENYMPTDI